MKLLFIVIVCIISAASLYAGNRNADTIIVQKDTSICAGNSLTLSIDFPAVTGNIIFPPGSDFEYSFNMPSPGWTMQMGGWLSGDAPFGNVTNGDPSVFDYYTFWPANIPDHTDGFDLYLRKQIDLSGYDLSNIHWYIGVDNGYALYLNGVLISSAFDGGYTYRWEYEGVLPSGLLNPGNNIIAIALSDNGLSTAFDMMLQSLPHCPCPKVLWSTGDTTFSIGITPNQTTKYFVTITNGLTITKDSVTVTVNHNSMQTISATICEGQSYAGHTMTGVYTDTIKTGSGCDSVTRLQLTVLSKPQPYLGRDRLICDRDSVLLTPGEFDTYTWQDGSHQKYFFGNRTGTYSVQVSNSCGIASSQVQVLARECEMTFPAAFTPNDDGKNDFFRLLNAHDLTEFHLVIYNRWGQKIFETKDYRNAWDGSLGGQSLTSGIYIWFCEFRKSNVINKIVLKGTVALIK